MNALNEAVGLFVLLLSVALGVIGFLLAKWMRSRERSGDELEKELGELQGEHRGVERRVTILEAQTEGVNERLDRHLEKEERFQDEVRESFRRHGEAISRLLGQLAREKED